jgi:transcriptional regulator with XRE-family HTH domain
VFGKILATLRKSKGLSQYELAEKLGLSRGQIGNYEQGKRQPDYDTLQLIADFFNVSTDYLLGRENEKSNNGNLPELTPKDERDIAKDLEKILSSLDNPNEGYSHFDGQSIDDLDEEDRELLKAALETSMKIAKQIAKKKYTPKKYRKNDD